MFADGAEFPWELLLNVVSHLGFEDFVNLKVTRLHLLRALRNEGLCRNIVKVATCKPPPSSFAKSPILKGRNRHCLPNSQRCIAYAREACLADQKIISYMTAVDRTFDRREAFALARPYSAFVVGQGTSFLYGDGVLCYRSRKLIRVLDVHDAAREETLIDLEALARSWTGVRRHSDVELLHYRAGILSFIHYLENDDVGPGRRERWLKVMDVRSGKAAMRLAVIIHRPRIWVRNNDRYLYVGCHDGRTEDGHHEWVVQGYDLQEGKPLASLSLPKFWGSDLRETIIFEIFDGYLHAVSNRSSFEMEEIDWTSFYFCLRVPVDDPKLSRLQRQKIWRRQHVEGPINDSWTDLGLHRDERTGELLIIEARKEWKNGLGDQKRTFYIERLDGTGWSSEDEGTSDTQSQSDHPGSPTPFPDEPITKLIEKGDRPLYADPRPRLHCQFYPERPGSEPPSDEFSIARTRYRTFLPASSAFLDVVLDQYPRYAPEALHPPRTGQQQIRLRIGSRLRASPLVSDRRDREKRVLRRPVLDQDDGLPLPESADRFVDRGIRLWPPATAPMELVELLNPGRGHVDEISAVADERSLVYQAAPSPSATGPERNLVLINFDRGVRHPGLPLLRWTGMDEPASFNVPAVTLSGQGSERREQGVQFAKWQPVRVAASEPKSVDPNPGTAETTAGAEAEPEKGPWWRREVALYLQIQQGYRFE